MRSSNVAASEISVVPVARIDVDHKPWRWPFVQERRSEIEAHFAALQREKPALWNGRVMMLRDFRIAGGVFRGACFDVDYASFISWQDWGFPDPEVYDCFAMGAIRASDGGFLLGVMAPHTFNAGQVYFPCGTPDGSDIAGDKIDFEGSIRRELAEETGLDLADFVAEPGWHTVLAGSAIAHIKLLRAKEPAQELRGRILDHLAREAEPELCGVRVARSPGDLDTMTPAAVTAFLRHIWSRE